MRHRLPAALAGLVFTIAISIASVPAGAQTVNPFVPKRSETSGSSSGSATGAGTTSAPTAAAPAGGSSAAAGPALPTTGAELADLTGTGLGCIATGITLVVVARRRRPRRRSPYDLFAAAR